MTSEITVPMTNDMPSYFIGRLCKGEKETDVIQHFFEELINKKLFEVGFIGGLDISDQIDNGILFCFTEIHSKESIDSLVDNLKHVN